MESVTRVPQLPLERVIGNGKLAQVEPSAERVTCTCHNGAAGRFVRTKALERVHQFITKRDGEGVLLLWPV